MAHLNYRLPRFHYSHLMSDARRHFGKFVSSLPLVQRPAHGGGNRQHRNLRRPPGVFNGKHEHITPVLKVTANLFGLEFCKILKSYHDIAHYIYFVLKKKLFENVFFLQSYCKFCVLRD